jgi:hypothetical protein
MWKLNADFFMTLLPLAVFVLFIFYIFSSDSNIIGPF